MITYKLETEIHKPLDTVIRLFADRSRLKEWQPGLLDIESIENSPYPKYKLTFQFGRRKMVMTETILLQDLPRQFEGTYVMKGVFNRINNSFEAIDPNTTRWVSEIEFRFKGLMSLVARFMKGDFEKQSMIIMSNFKKFAESL